MPWSIFTQGGGQGAAVTWAIDALKKIGAPLTKGNEQLIYDWEVSEGGGGKYNPLNMGPVPGDPALTTTGSQYGGGAADYASWDAGLEGFADYMSMGAYSGVLDNLMNNDPQAARDAIIASPWAASHYGGGARFSSEALPGKKSALAGGAGSSSGKGFDWNPLSWPGQIASSAASGITSTVQEVAVLVPLLLGAAALGVIGLAKASGATTKAKEGAGMLGQAAATGAVL